MTVKCERCNTPLDSKSATHVKLREVDNKGNITIKEYYYCDTCIKSSNLLK
jgi:uncharacterized protein with PIN domain